MIVYTLITVILALYAIVLLAPAVAVLFSENKTVSGGRTFISVLVPARNEAGHVIACLESILQQDYARNAFEVLVIDDHSTDETFALATQFAYSHPNVRVLRSAGEGKKAAIVTGVQAANGTIIATTDADCVHGREWLSAIGSVFREEGVQLAGGLVIYGRRGGWLRGFLQIEQCALQLVSAGMAKFGFPVMCSGASLAYRKAFFEAARAYENDPFVSGDDMQLLLKAQRTNVRFFTAPRSIVRTAAVATWKEAVTQRARWLSKFRAYSGGRTAALAWLVLLANLLPWGALALGRPLFLTALAGKTAVDLLLLSLGVPIFREPLLLLLVLPGELFYPVLALAASVKSLTGTIRWKGRSWKQ